MCIATVSLLGAIGAGLGAGGKVLGGFAQANQAGYQAQVAQNNATIEQQNAGYAASAGAAQTEQAGLKARAQDADTRASIAANNIDVNSGSAADVQTSQREIGQLNAETVANNAALQAYGYETQATDFQAQAGLFKSEEVPDVVGGVLSGAGSFLGNADVDSALGGSPQLTQTPIDAGPLNLTPGPSLLSVDNQLPDGFGWMADNGGGSL